jgi:hypothetical protein
VDVKCCRYYCSNGDDDDCAATMVASDARGKDGVGRSGVLRYSKFQVPCL